MNEAPVADKKETGTIVTPVFRLAFPSVFQQTKNRNNDPSFKARWEITMLYPKPGNAKVLAELAAAGVPKPLIDASLDLTELKRIMTLAAKKFFGDKLNDPAFRKTLANPIRDADAEQKETAGYAGHIFICAWNRNAQPPVVNAQKIPVTDAAKVYGGMYCRAHINAFGWEFNKMKRGVSFGLQALQLVRDGAPFAVTSDPDKVFTALEAAEGSSEDPGAYKQEVNSDPFA